MGTLRNTIMSSMQSYQPPSHTRRRGPQPKLGSRYALSQATGIPQSSLSRFALGKTGLNLDSLERLCAELQLVLIPTGDWRLQNSRNNLRGE